MTTTQRIKSNATTHGMRWAVAQEISRAKRRGLSNNAAVSWGLAMVSSTLRHRGAA